MKVKPLTYLYKLVKILIGIISHSRWFNVNPDNLLHKKIIKPSFLLIFYLIKKIKIFLIYLSYIKNNFLDIGDNSNGKIKDSNVKNKWKSKFLLHVIYTAYG